MGGSFKIGMRVFGWQIEGWGEFIGVAVLRLGCNYLGGSFQAEMRLFGWLGRCHLVGSFEAGMTLFGWQF